MILHLPGHDLCACQQELLALEERMGTVSTALPEEAVSKCLQRSIYQGTHSELGAFGGDENEAEVKCSICQVHLHSFAFTEVDDSLCFI